MNHDHDDVVIAIDAIAYYSKRDDGQTDDAQFFAGTVKKCRYCDRLIFHPKGDGLAPVEVDLATDDEVQTLKTIERRRRPRTEAA